MSRDQPQGASITRLQQAQSLHRRKGWQLTITEGRWIPPFDTGDEATYANYRTIDELAELSQITFDIVVIGCGGAGAVAAIEVADGGASVLVLEATSFPG